MQNNNKKSELFELSPQKILAGVGLMALITLSLFKFSAGIDSAWISGFHHPLEGWDHLLTMITVGIWAAQLRGHAIWLLPLAFVGVMSLGGLAGAAGIVIPSAEGLILLSCAVFSLLIIRKARFSTRVSVMIVAFFAFFHGFAHGQEVSTSASLMSYTFGFMLATLLLHGAGIIVAKLVVLSVTCLMAIFFSGIAQAYQFESKTAIGNKNASQVNIQLPSFSRNSPAKELYQLDNPATVHGLAEHRFCPKDYPQDADIQVNGTTRFTKTYALVCYFEESSASAIDAFHDGLTLSKALVFTHENMCHELRFFYSVNIHGSRIEFKHYFPDINHSPGKDILSNGVGLTSPPAFSANSASPQDTALYRHIQVSSFEDNKLQMTVASLSFSKCSYNKIIFCPSDSYGFGNRIQAIKELPISELYKHEYFVYVAPITLIFNPYSSATAPVFELDWLLLAKKNHQESNSRHRHHFYKNLPH